MGVIFSLLQIYMAVDEVRSSLKLLDRTCTRLSHIFNSVYLCTYIWVQKIKQLGFVDSVMDEKEVSAQRRSPLLSI